ncbi:MAG TPA: glycoside hydrolase family 27 protein [Rhizomicrobium sp.]
MGWNSWDSFGPTIREDEARANAAIMAGRLLPHGYTIFTVDIQWYEPGANGYDYRKGAELTMDAWGRLLPAPNRFPSAAGGAGFKPLADHVHGLGLKFGLHMMRGVPRQAADRDTPILGTDIRAGEIADRVNVCPWNTDMYGIDMSKPGAQAYYDSVFRLYASWGVDFVKADDLSRPYIRNKPEIEAVRAAIDRSGRPMILSLSPGETPLAAAAHVRSHANMWRISDDFWDTWPALLEQFTRLADWNATRRPGNWPDADMLPLGLLEMGKRRTRFTPDEQKTLLTLWSIARSPLIMGGDLRHLDEATYALLTNDEVLGVNQVSRNNRQIVRSDEMAVWAAQDARGSETIVALFNLRDPGPDAPVPVTLAQLGLTGTVRVRDLWQRRAIAAAQGRFAPGIPCHGAGLYRLTRA